MQFVRAKSAIAGTTRPAGSLKKTVLTLAFALAGLGATAQLVCAASIGLVGLYPGKAIFIIDGRSPKTFSVGQTISGDLKLLSVESDSATLDNKGKREKYMIGDYVSSRSASGPASTTLSANEQGHYVVTGQINGGMVEGLIDTGATLIAIPAQDAVRLGIHYREGTPMRLNTANGSTVGYLVKLNTVKIGDIELNQVDAVVQESGLPFTLFGMSFLNRTEMKRDGNSMVLTKRF